MPAGPLPAQVLDTLTEGCQVISPDYTYLYLNDAAVRHSRRTREALLGRRMGEVYPGIEKTPMFAMLRRCMVERVPLRMENGFEYPVGGSGHFELRFEPVPEGVFILSLDVTEWKQAVAEWARLSTAIDQAAESMLLTSATGEIQYVNPAFELMTGYRREEVLGKNPRILSSGKHDAGFYDMIQTAYARLTIANVLCADQSDAPAHRLFGCAVGNMIVGASNPVDAVICGAGYLLVHLPEFANVVLSVERHQVCRA